MSLNSLLKKLAKTKQKVQKKADYDKFNLSDDVRGRSPLVKSVVSRTARNFIEKVLGEDITVLPEDYDTNKQASLALQQFIMTSIAENPSANLISIEIVADSSEDIFVEDEHIIIYTNDGVSDHDSVKALIDGDAEAASLITVEINAGQGLTLVTEESTQSLSGAL